MSKRGIGLYNYTGLNPFKDGQSRTFPDDKVLNEFCPTSLYWSLFNDQHEILLGTRGSGKTILLKMMRYSLLSKLNHEEAKKLTKEKRYIGIYVPLNLEFLGSLLYQEVPEKIRLPFFQFAFNCFLAQSAIHEFKAIIAELPGFIEQAIASMELAKKIMPLWFPGMRDDNISCIDDISSLINEMYFANDLSKHDLSSLPRAFTGPIINPLQAICKSVIPILGLNDDVRWIICIDEAEFLDDLFQRCINTVFRSDSRGIIIKMATLPFKHTTRETLTPNVYSEANGNDFNYRVIDMKHDSIDFINVTNHLCRKRLGDTSDRLADISSLDEFTRKLGGDDLIDYYKEEFNDVTQRDIEEAIITEMSPDRKNSSIKKVQDHKSRKPVYDRFAPIFFCREMYKQSRKGNHIPAWFAGPKMIRKTCDGNPRLFIQLMNDMFEYGRKHADITFKLQHKVVCEFAKRICETTKGLPGYGPQLGDALDIIAETIKLRVHNGYLIDVGNDFTISASDLANNETAEILKLGIQYSRLTVDDQSVLGELTDNTTFYLSVCYSVKYWIPVRKSSAPKLSIKAIGLKNNTCVPGDNNIELKQPQLFYGE